jgi:DNA-binding response OmpR family regulator
MTAKILIVEDETALLDTLVRNLSQQGYSVETAQDGQMALEVFHKNAIDLVVLDLMLPIINGFEVCRSIRQESTIPIIMLTAGDSESNRVTGLEIGADDFLSKPFSMQELNARIKALLRRARMNLNG